MFSEWRKRRERRHYEREMRKRHGDDFDPAGRPHVNLPPIYMFKPYEVVAHWRGGPRRLRVPTPGMIENLTDGETYIIYSDLKSERTAYWEAMNAFETVPKEHIKFIDD